MSSSEPEQTGLLNPVDEPNKRPFGAPGFMYAFFCFLFASGLALVANYVEALPYPAQLIALFVAAGLYLECLALIFFEPSVMLGDDVVHYRSQKPSVWQAPPRMFRWTTEYVDEKKPFSTFRGVELDYTRVPFPLPLFPFTLPFFHITRWILTIKREDGSYCLLEVGPTPNSFREVAQKVSEFTELPLKAPWFDGFEEDETGSWLWTAGTDQNPDGKRIRTSLEQTDLALVTDGSALEFPVENRLSAFWRCAGLVVTGICFLAGVIAVLAGFQYNPGTPMGLLLGMIWMLSGVLAGTLGILILADCISSVRSKLRFDENGIQVEHPVGQSTFIRYDDLVAVRGVRQDRGSSMRYGLGKPVPCLEVYGKGDWFYVALNEERTLDGFLRCFRNLT